MTEQPHDPEVDEVLVELLASLGAVAPFGGGASGVRWTAKRLQTETASAHLSAGQHSVDEVVTRLVALLGATSEQRGPNVTLLGAIDSGFLGMNPAVVRCEVRPTGDVLVAAYAKEGRIKQQTAAKAIAKVSDALL